MSILLGVDTGGTFTDAVLIKDEHDIVASAKSLTTRHDLSVGIGNAVSSVLNQSGICPGDIGLAALSTTLATNALVEGQGERVALIFVGFRQEDLTRHGLSDALRGDPALVLKGGHGHAGQEIAPLDIDALSAWLETVSDVSAFAVASQFATRNPAHENRISELIRERTGKPVSCSHHLSAKLNGPKRALTAVLNARLIGMIDRLIRNAQSLLVDKGITAPLMVVRGDGALISAAFAREKPIETILSGPAASIVGARWLTGVDNALISDIGGTTTDVALLKDGKPAIDPEGARVGPFRTMVEAVAMRTTGLGGDSEVHFLTEGLTGGIELGPKRVIPLSLLATEARNVVMPALEEQVRDATPGEYDGRFVRPVEGADTAGLSDRDAKVLSRLGGVLPVGKLLKTRIEGSSLRRLWERGIVQISAITPTDACHVLGMLSHWDKDAARLGLELMSQRRSGNGERLASSPEEMARLVVDQMTLQTSTALLETVFAEDPADFGGTPAEMARHPMLVLALGQYSGILSIGARFSLPVVGLGASASTYYGRVGENLGCEMILPESGGVANAIGAVTGRVSVRESGSVTNPQEGVFRVYGTGNPVDFRNAEEAMNSLEESLSNLARDRAMNGGADGVTVSTRREIRKSNVEGREVFVEAEIVAEASGRPRIADGPE